MGSMIPLESHRLCTGGCHSRRKASGNPRYSGGSAIIDAALNTALLTSTAANPGGYSTSPEVNFNAPVSSWESSVERPRLELPAQRLNAAHLPAADARSRSPSAPTRSSAAQAACRTPGCG